MSEQRAIGGWHRSAATVGVAASAFTLALGCLLALREPERVSFFTPPAHLVDVMQPAPPGWTSVDCPLGETEVVKAKVHDVLGFDDAFVRQYQKGSAIVAVYAAYWRPGVADPLTIGLHTPDTCWTLAGATIGLRDDFLHMQMENGLRIVPAHYRIFHWPSAEQMVVYWHFYGGRLTGFPIHSGGRFGGWWKEFKASVVNTEFCTQRKEQVFLRISSNLSLEELQRTEIWPVIISSLAKTGLIEREPRT